MTNEELVKLIQDGRHEYIPQLWEQVRRFICREARRRLSGEPLHLHDLEDDLINEAYFGLLGAVRGYQFDAGSGFLGYLTFYLKTGFNKALGAWTARDKQNRQLLDQAVSTEQGGSRRRRFDLERHDR